MDINEHDTLVMSIRYGETENEIFYLHDYKTDLFSLRGNVKDNRFVSVGQYSFECDDIDQVVVFSSFLISKCENLTCKLYAIKDLPKNVENISYDLLKNKVVSVKLYESEYDSKYNSFTSSIFNSLLNMLKNVYTTY